MDSYCWRASSIYLSILSRGRPRFGSSRPAGILFIHPSLDSLHHPRGAPPVSNYLVIRPLPNGSTFHCPEGGDLLCNMIMSGQAGESGGSRNLFIQPPSTGSPAHGLAEGGRIYSSSAQLAHTLALQVQQAFHLFIPASTHFIILGVRPLSPFIYSSAHCPVAQTSTAPKGVIYLFIRWPTVAHASGHNIQRAFYLSIRVSI